jgi:uncharacterized protein (TIGR03067 family)
MIRFTTFCGLVLVLTVPATAQDKKDVPKELAPFQGKWKVVKMVDRGEEAPAAFLASLKLGFAFEGEKFTIKRDDPVTGSFSVDAKKEPAEIDLVEAKGSKIFGIYKFDKDGKLTLTYRKGSPNAKPEDRPKKFDDKDAVTMVLEKVKE